MATSLTDQFLEQQSKGSLTDQMVTSTDPASKEVFDLPKTDYDDLMRSASEEHGVPYEILYRNLRQESRFNPKAVSKNGARGIAQFIPSTAKAMGVKDPHDPKQAIPGAAKYIKQLYDQFGDWKLAIAAYNAGPEAVKRAGNKIPNIDETQKHIKAVFPDGKEYPRPEAKQTTISRGGLTDALMQVKSKGAFDPESSDYDYATAEKFGLKPDDTGHWPSREPSTGMLLKGRKHETWPLTEKGEAEAGFEIVKKDGRYYSIKKSEVSPKEFYTRNAFSPFGVMHPAMSAKIGRQGFGPKPEGGWDELGRPLDAAGEPYVKEGIKQEKVAGPIAETLKGLTSMATNPMEVIKGGLDFALSIPGFTVGLLGAAGRGGKEIASQLAYGTLDLDQVYTAMSKGMQESFEFFEPGKRMVVGEPTKVSQLVGEVAMAPMSVVMATGQKVAAAEMFKDSPNIRGAAKILGDGLGLMAMGLILHGPSRRAEFSREAEGIVKEAETLQAREVEISQGANSLVQEVQRKALEIEKQLLESKAAEFSRKFQDDVLLVEDAGRLAEDIAKSKIRPETYSRPEMAEDYVAKPVKLNKKEQAKQDKLKAKESETAIASHGTDIDSLEGILSGGLKPGSALDFTPDRLWSSEYPIQVETSNAKKGTYVEHNKYYKSSGTAKVDKVTVDLSHYDSVGTERVTKAIEDLKKKYPNIKFEVKGEGSSAGDFNIKNMTEFLQKEYNLPLEEAREMAKEEIESSTNREPKNLYGYHKGSFQTVKEWKDYSDWLVKQGEKGKDVTKDSLQEQIDSNPELAGKIRVDALGEEGTTLLPGNAQVTILEPGKESSFTAKADIGDIVDKYKSKLGEYEVAEKKKGTTVITRKKSGESVKKFKGLEESKVEAEETMSPELLKHLDSMIEESEAPVGKVAERKAKAVEEPITEVDKGTGSDVPSEVINDSFMRPLKDAENLDRIFKEREKALSESPEMYVQKLINDVRLWKHGKDVDIKAVRGALSEMGARAGELRHFFDTGVDHIQFMDVAREAAKWAQNTGRIKTGGPRLNVMIPLDQIPDSVRHWYNYTKGMFGKVGAKDVYRNKELWKATGFWYGRDGKWRFELDDSGAKYSPTPMALKVYKDQGFATEMLTAALDHPKLYEQVPKLKRAMIEYDRTLPAKGEYRIADNTIVLKAPHYKNTLFHEIAHGINREANAFSGGSPGGVLVERTRQIIKDLKAVAKTDEVRAEITYIEKDFNKGRISLDTAVDSIIDIVDKRAPKSIDKFIERLKEILDEGSAFDEYLRIPGEMESRLTERRLNMSKEARMSEPPWQTLDRMLAQEGINPEVGRKLYSGVPLDEAIKLAKKTLASINTPNRLEKFVRDKFSDLLPDNVKIVWLSEMQIPKDWPAKANAKFDWLEDTVYISSNTKYRSRKGLKPLTESEIAEALVHELQHLKESNEIKSWDEFAKKKETELGDKFTYVEWEKHPSESGPIDKGILARGMFEDVLVKEYQTGTKLYSGLPVDEAAKAIVAGAKKVAEYTTKARGMKKFKPGAAFQKVREEFVRSAIDRSGNIRKDLIEVLGEDGYKVVQKMYLAKGASARSVKELKQMKAEVYEGLSVREKKILDDIILDDRMIDIAKYRGEGEFNFPKGLTPKDFIAHRTLFGEIEGLSKEQVAKLNQRASAYFEWMKKPLKDMLESGLISKEEFDKLASHNYRRIKLVDIFDKRYSTKVGDKKRTVYDSGVEALARGRETDIYEPSSEIMALEVFNRAYGRILNNEANKMLLELAEKDNENPFVRIKSKDRNEKIPSGWNRIFVFDKGERKSLWISPEMGKEWIIRSPEISYKMGQVLRYASGSPVLRTFATGINWGFALANIPKDVMHTWFTARTWKDGEWKPVYSPHAPMFALQMGRDIGNVFLDAALRKGRYNDYIDQGGGMEFLVHQGRLLQRGRHVDSKLGDVLDFMGYFGETSEIMTRLAIRDRVIRNEAKKRGISFEEASKDKDITAEATFAARDYMDFGQGGGISKAADNALPYLNAAIQGTRGIMRSFKPGSGSALESTYKLAQFGTAVVGTYIAANALAPNTMKSLQGDVAMQSNLCIPLGDEFSFQDENGETRYIYLKIPLDPGQKFFKTIFEGATDKWLGNEVDVDRITGTLNDMSPVGISQLPPTISATLGYMSNKDFWLNEDIWKGTDKAFPYPQSKEEFTGKTPQAYVDVGKVTGLSPERTKYAVEELITNGTIWSYLINQGYDAAFGDISKERKEQHLAMVLAKFPGIKRFIGVTNPYSKHAQKIETATTDATIKRFIENREMDIRIDGYLYGKLSRKEMVDYARSFKDIDTFDRLMERYEWEKAIQNIPEKSFWRRMKGIPNEAKAKVFVERLNNSSPAQQKQLWREFGVVSEAGNVISDNLMELITKERYRKVD